ncbi:uncharacterized protein LOC143909211 [Arctopsyche grandis]|uniref:uncharacterized protein LOC143909211 n=1 Tax=Arctopsyche grandis TaxID=121162 RepID=UPI00406D863D
MKNNKQILIEKSVIRLKRSIYLSKLEEYRLQGRPIVYTDESYINSSHTMPKSWSDETSKGCRVPIYKGNMLIIVHACSEKGFIPNALLIYPTKIKPGDYHNNMNAINYQKWIKEKLVPNLQPQSVIVIGNASYHNVMSEPMPTSNSRKADMLAWLRKFNIPYPEKCTKPFVLDKILEAHGHNVLRLPPYHPELNPIELLWGIIKGKVASKNVMFDLKVVEELFRKEAESITIDKFRDVWRHVKKHEEKFIELEPKLDNLTDNFTDIIKVEYSEYMDSSSDGELSGVEEL